MTQGKTLIIAVVALLFGFGAGFTLRPILSPPPQSVAVAGPSPSTLAPTEARGTQYFVAHIDEARQVQAGCRNGSVRGDECATAEEVIIKVEAQERRKRFLGN